MSSLVGAGGGDPAVAQEDDVVGLVEQERARGHDDGGAPGPGPVSRPAMRASVCASTALVGSTSTSVSALGEQRPGQGEALALAAGEGPAALLDLVVEPAGQRLEHVVAARDREGLEDRGVVVVAPRVELVAQGAGEEAGVGLARRRPGGGPRASGGVGEAGPVERAVGLLGTEAAEPVGERRGVLGARRHDDGEATRLDADAAARVEEAGRRRSAAAARPASRRGRAAPRRIRISLRAPMCARVARSTISVAVRSGMTRKAV